MVHGDAAHPAPQPVVRSQRAFLVEAPAAHDAAVEFVPPDAGVAAAVNRVVRNQVLVVAGVAPLQAVHRVAADGVDVLTARRLGNARTVARADVGVGRHRDDGVGLPRAGRAEARRARVRPVVRRVPDQHCVGGLTRGRAGLGRLTEDRIARRRRNQAVEVGRQHRPPVLPVLVEQNHRRRGVAGQHLGALHDEDADAALAVELVVCPEVGVRPNPVLRVVGENGPGAERVLVPRAGRVRRGRHREALVVRR